MNTQKGGLTVVWRDGREHSGRTPEAVVQAMLEGSVFTSGMTTTQYMAGVARRAKDLCGARVRGRDAMAFLRDLADHGLVTLRWELPSDGEGAMKAYVGGAGRSWLYRVHAWLRAALRRNLCVLRWRCYWCGGRAQRWTVTPGGRVPCCGTCATGGA